MAQESLRLFEAAGKLRQQPNAALLILEDLYSGAGGWVGRLAG